MFCTGCKVLPAGYSSMFSLETADEQPEPTAKKRLDKPGGKKYINRTERYLGNLDIIRFTKPTFNIGTRYVSHSGLIWYHRAIGVN
jgi:hypothetical protein